MILLIHRRPLGQERVKNYLPNPFRSVPNFGILLLLTADDFAHPEETSWTGKG